MIKPLVICFHSVILFIFSFFFGDSPNSVTGNFPKNAKAGSEFQAEIVVKKGNIGGFAKLQVEVPAGFRVKETDSKGAAFSFENNIAKYIWTSAPADAEFTVKFSVQVDAAASGVKTIAAKYSYVNNNAKEVVEMQPAEIMVGDHADAIAANDNSAPADNNTTPTTNTPTVTPDASAGNSVTPATNNTPAPTNSNGEPGSNVTCTRAITPSPTAGEYIVQVRIKRPGIKGFAKYQDILPAGYTAKAGTQTAGSSFSVSDGKAKFVWVSLPAEDEMTVTYVLEKAATAAPDARIEGEFSYLEDNQTKKVKLPAEPVESGSAVANNNNVPSNASGTETVTAKTTTTVSADNTSAQTAKETGKAPLSKKEGNVAYCVQIGAFRNAIAADVLTKKFNLSEAVRSEMTDGYNKFMVGNFNDYKGAHDHRNNIKQKGCTSAFVAAYNGPKRITVQEALMITNQKWFK